MDVGELAPLVPTVVGVAESGRRHNSAAQGLLELMLWITLATAPQLLVAIVVFLLLGLSLRIMVHVLRAVARAFFRGSLQRAVLFFVAIADIYWAGSRLLAELK